MVTPCWIYPAEFSLYNGNYLIANWTFSNCILFRPRSIPRLLRISILSNRGSFKQIHSESSEYWSAPTPPPYLRFVSLCVGVFPRQLPTLRRQDNMGQDANSGLQGKLDADAHHRRGYQACDPCRKRKVKCDLGSMSPFHMICVLD